MHTKIKYISIAIGLLGLIPFGLPLIENFLLVSFVTGLNRIDFTIFYGTTMQIFYGRTWFFRKIVINGLWKNHFLP